MQFRLRTLLVILALIGLPFAFGAPWIVVGEFGRRDIYGLNVVFFGIALIEVALFVAWKIRRQK